MGLLCLASVSGVGGVSSIGTVSLWWDQVLFQGSTSLQVHVLLFPQGLKVRWYCGLLIFLGFLVFLVLYSLVVLVKLVVSYYKVVVVGTLVSYHILQDSRASRTAIPDGSTRS